MKLIVGLGNPGAEYAMTRHNAGFMVVDRLAQRHAPGAVWRAQFQSMCITCDLPLPGQNAGPTERVVLIKPTTFMNLSGQAVIAALNFYKLNAQEDLIVLVDDLALPCGHIRSRSTGGAGGHNGLSNIEQLLSSPAYPRMRIGIDEKGLANQVNYVLGRFTDEQLQRLKPALDTACDACQLWAHEGLTAAMNTYNTKAEKKPKPKPKIAKQEPKPEPEPKEQAAPEQASDTAA